MEEKKVDLRHYIKMVRKRWEIILVIFLVSTITSGVVSFFLPKTYEATALVKIGRMKESLLEEPSGIMKESPLEEPSAVIEILKTKPILERVAKELNIPPTQGKLGELASMIKMREKPGLLLEITGKGETPEEALKLVNGVTVVLLRRHEQIFEQLKVALEEYLASGKERLVDMEKEIKMLQKKIEQLGAPNSAEKATLALGYMESLERSRDRYEQLEVQLREKKMEGYSGTVPTELVVPATIPEYPTSPKMKQNILIAGILGLFIGFVCVAIVEYFEKPSVIS
jgi:uncharacterized protein involved in exopolysaccharide biosynthesis